jgi:hypothetical protein
MTSTPEQISNIVDRYEKDVKNIKDDALKISWYMRGGVSYQDAMNMSTTEKELVSKIIKDNLETTKKTGMPFY